MMENVVSLAISFIALGVSLATLYLQSIRVIGAVISLINEEDRVQRTVVMPSFGRFPEIIRQEFPEYIEKYPGYAEFRLNFANTGDRTGITEIKKIEVKSPQASSSDDQIKASYYDFNLIPPYEMKDQTVILRNIPVTNQEWIIDITIKISCGGAHPKNGKYQEKSVIERTLKLLLVPSELRTKVTES